jgi:hypothetical protein
MQRVLSASSQLMQRVMLLLRISSTPTFAP